MLYKHNPGVPASLNELIERRLPNYHDLQKGATATKQHIRRRDRGECVYESLQMMKLSPTFGQKIDSRNVIVVHRSDDGARRHEDRIPPASSWSVSRVSTTQASRPGGPCVPLWSSSGWPSGSITRHLSPIESMLSKNAGGASRPAERQTTVDEELLDLANVLERDLKALTPRAGRHQTAPNPAIPTDSSGA